MTAKICVAFVAVSTHGSGDASAILKMAELVTTTWGSSVKVLLGVGQVQ